MAFTCDVAVRLALRSSPSARILVQPRPPRRFPKANGINSFPESRINYVRTFSKRSTRGQSFFTLPTPMHSPTMTNDAIGRVDFSID